MKTLTYRKAKIAYWIIMAAAAVAWIVNLSML